VALRLFFVDVHFIPQTGMHPTFPKGSYVVTGRRPYDRVGEVSRGDVVVFVRIQNGARYLYIWRVIGLPGDRVVTSGESLIVNDETVAREAVR
jgi:signal peptidase I